MVTVAVVALVAVVAREAVAVVVGEVVAVAMAVAAVVGAVAVAVAVEAMAAVAGEVEMAVKQGAGRLMEAVGELQISSIKFECHSGCFFSSFIALLSVISEPGKLGAAAAARSVPLAIFIL